MYEFIKKWYNATSMYIFDNELVINYMDAYDDMYGDSVTFVNQTILTPRQVINYYLCK